VLGPAAAGPELPRVLVQRSEPVSSASLRHWIASLRSQ